MSSIAIRMLLVCALGTTVVVAPLRAAERRVREVAPAVTAADLPTPQSEVSSGPRIAGDPSRPSGDLRAKASAHTPGNLAQRVVSFMQQHTDGVVGVYLKEIGGPVLAAFNEATVFEPASTLKVTVHLHGILQVQNTSATLDDPITWLADAGKFDGNGNYMCGGNDCYADNTVPQSSDRDDAHSLMMWCSDNALTQALRDTYSDTAIEDTIYNVVGMSADTQLNHSMGCGPDAVADHNQLTLVDLALLHEQVATGLLAFPSRVAFYALMPNTTGFFETVVAQEAVGLGLTSEEIEDVQDGIAAAWKGGSYGLSDGQYRSLAGWVRVPFACEGVNREYFFGNFIDQATDLDLQDTGAELDIFEVAGELLRDEILAALESKLCARPPEVTAPADLTLECSQPGGVASDDPLVLAWLSQATAQDECDEVDVGHDPLPLLIPATCGAVSAQVEFSAVDQCSATGTDSATVTVLDTTPPQLACSLSKQTLWPPNHGYVDVGLHIEALDVCDPTLQIEVAVTSDEPAATAAGAGGPSHCPDAVLNQDGSLWLRAERSGAGDGRVYGIEVNATDACGNVATCSLSVGVPHSPKSPAVDSGQTFVATSCTSP